MKRRLLLVLPVVVLVSLFIITGFRGIDFGNQWDENGLHMVPVRNMVRTGVFLPHEYTYPSLSKWLVLLPAWPGTLSMAIRTHGDPLRTRAVMQEIVDAPHYLLAARRVFIVLSSLTIVWVYAAVLALRRPRWEATVAACCIGLSWEFAYHSRFVANDCILTQFSALTLFALARFYRRNLDYWLYIAAMAAGLGTGAKQPGVFLLVPVILISSLSMPLNEPLRQLRRAALLFAIAGASFIVTTPGVLLEPFTFVDDGQKIAIWYARGHGQFTAHSAWQHWGWVWTYLSVEFFSPWHPASIALSACVVLGMVVWVRREWRFVAPLIVFPPLFLLIFCSKYSVMICRNYLQFTPILSVLAARGVAEIFERLKFRWARWGLAGTLTLGACAQAIFLIGAAESIRHIDKAAYVRDAVGYVADHPREQFRVSPQVRALAAQQGLAMPANVTTAPGGQAVVMFGLSEMGDPGLYKENDPWLTDAIFGPRDINFNWYSVWVANDRVVVMPIEKARAGGVPLAL